ncbi:MAG: IS630 family transposase [Anaerolineales bacterium]|nr:IS630 family transposase [Anaerolineales bacterium]
MPMNTRNGATSKLQHMPDAQIGQYANGDNAGQRARGLKTCQGPGRRGVFPPEVRAQATALACSLPKEKGVPLSRWSLAEIAKHLLSLQAVSEISASTLFRWFTADKLKPWRFHNWQHILDSQKFLERARPVLQVYEKAVELLQNGTWAVCVDEKTSIQARQLEQEPVPAKPKQPVHVAPRYKRQGALQLFAGLSVADGCKYGQTSERKRFVDFQTFLLQVIIPQALRRMAHTLILILDNGTTHAPKQLETWLQTQAHLNNWPLTIQVYWLPTNASWLDQIELWFSVLQRKLLTPNHFHDTEELTKAIMEFIKRENLSPKPIRWTYTIQKLETKLGTVY